MERGGGGGGGGGAPRLEAPRPGPPREGRPALGGVGPDVLLFLARPKVGAERCQVAAVSSGGPVSALSGGGERKNISAPSRKPGGSGAAPLRGGQRECRAGTAGNPGGARLGNRAVWGDVQCLGVPLSCSLNW